MKSAYLVLGLVLGSAVAANASAAGLMNDFRYACEVWCGDKSIVLWDSPSKMADAATSGIPGLYAGFSADSTKIYLDVSSLGCSRTEQVQLFGLGEDYEEYVGRPAVAVVIEGDTPEGKKEFARSREIPRVPTRDMLRNPEKYELSYTSGDLGVFCTHADINKPWNSAQSAAEVADNALDKADTASVAAAQTASVAANPKAEEQLAEVKTASPAADLEVLTSTPTKTASVAATKNSSASVGLAETATAADTATTAAGASE
ncbi:MAG: hypothetical protein AB1540_09145 [Bdellovibrionota bacterium]